jgi:hypothetical protein
MVGPFDTDVPVAGITSTPSGIIASPFYGFSNGYVVATTLTAGKGYWVMTSSAGTLHFTGDASSSLTGTWSVDPTWPRLTFTEQQGQSRDLHLAPVSELNESYRVPPVPPSGVFDVRFSANTSVERLGSGTHEVDISASSYPIVLKASNLGDRRLHVQDGITGTLLSEDLTDATPVTITQGLNRIRITESLLGADVPREFSLSQNYPNPFNPVTTIKFALPTATRVTLTVYDLLGAKVADVVDGEYEAGYHNVLFDAGKIASGVYFYRISAGGFTAVKKLMILK